MNKAAPREPRPPRRDSGEIKYHGTAACLALWKHRPHDIIRLYVQENRVGEFGELLKWAARARKAYHLVGPADLERLTESVHHQGICILAREKPQPSLDDLKQELTTRRGPSLLVYLDAVENPHNLGAIVRTCAHFGVHYLLGKAGQLPRLSPSAIRIAEGGAETVNLVSVRNPEQALSQLQSLGFGLIGTAVGGRSRSLYRFGFPERSLLIMGAEVEGMSEQMRGKAEQIISIPGSGLVDSLNVSVAFGVLAGEYYRQHQSGG